MKPFVASPYLECTFTVKTFSVLLPENLKMHPNWFCASSSAVSPVAAPHCHSNGKQCNAEVRTPPVHFPCTVGGRVYFRSSGVYVNEKGRDC